jgi:hypothetical protein
LITELLGLQPKTTQLSKVEIQKSLISITGKTNLSLEAASSQTLRNMILTAIRVGQENPTVEPGSLFPMTSRRVLTAQFIDADRRLYDYHLGHYRAHHFIALAIDAGKLGRCYYLDILITNAFLDAPR